jgi:hypothetical protein
MSLIASMVVALIALALDAGVGYPAGLFRLIGHPVTWIGALIDRLDLRFNLDGLSFATRTVTGTLSMGIVVGAAIVAGLAVEAVAGLAGYPLALLITAVAASSLLAARSSTATSPPWPRPCGPAGSPPAAKPSRPSSGATRKRSTSPASAVPPSKAWPKACATASWRRSSGSPFSVCPAPPPTRRSTPPIR